MKKAISVILAILFVFSVSGCGDTRPDVPSETEHSHDVETVETTSETEHVHDFQIAETKEATCISPEKELYRCAECGEEKTETVGKPLGHLFASKEPANFGDYVVCEREDCDHIEIKWNPQYSDQLVYVSCEQDEEDMRELYAELHEILQSIGDYGSENTVDAGEEYAVFAEKYQRFNSLFDAINNMAYKAYLISRISFNGENVENYVEGMTAYIKAQELQAKMTLAIYNSAFRDIVYKDHSREELDLMIKKAGVTGNEELTALKIKNEEILASRYEINNYDERLALYGDFVENNKKIAALFGYENYWECANREIRFRDCSAEDVDLMFAYTKQYLIPLWKNRNIDIPAYGEKDASLIRALTKKPFYQDELAFNTMKDFFGKVNITYNNEKISALSLFEDVLKNGNCFITDGHTELTYSDEWSIPVLLYADNLVLANGTTYSVVHEFGHYINFYLDPKYGVLDICETQSMSMEKLYIAYLCDILEPDSCKRFERNEIANIEKMINYLITFMFEKSVYLDSYTGLNCETIMADNKITKDEYGFLIDSIVEELDYWVEFAPSIVKEKIFDPCYAISYFMGELGSMQIYAIAKNEGLEKAVEVYAKLFDFQNVLEDQSYESVMEFAGLSTYSDEKSYINIVNCLDS